MSPQCQTPSSTGPVYGIMMMYHQHQRQQQQQQQRYIITKRQSTSLSPMTIEYRYNLFLF